jgi:uncharacterized membrane protein
MTMTHLVRLLQALSLCLLVLFTLPLVAPGPSSIGWWLMQVLPLLLLLPQLHKGSRRPLQWLGFLVLFYFTAAILQLFSPLPLQRWLGGLTVLCCVIMFIAALVRLRARAPDTE